MIIQIRHGKETATYGTWLPLDQVDEAITNALQHNLGNVYFTSRTCPIEVPYYQECMDKIFKYIVDEFDFLKEFDEGHSILDKQVEATYDVLYHKDFGLMAECNSKFRTHIRRLMFGDE